MDNINYQQPVCH